MAKDYLIERVEATAEWRAIKASQYPNDERNIEASTDLEKIAVGLRGMPNDEPIFALIDRLLGHCGDAPGGDDVFSYISEWESEFFRDIGFRSGYEDAKAFLEAYYRQMRQILEDNGMLAPRPVA